MTVNDVPLKRIKDALQVDGVWVSPSLRADVTKSDEARIEKAVDAAKPKSVYVALVEVPYDDPQLHGDVPTMFAIINDDTGLDGTFIGVEGYEKPTVAVEVIGGERSDEYAGWVAQQRHPDDLTDQVVDAVTLIDKGNAMSVYDRLEGSGQDTKTAQEGESSFAEDEDSGLSTGLIVGLVIAVIIAVIAVGLFVRTRRQRSAKAGFALPANVLTTVRAAERRRLLKRAKQDALRLGERIDAAPMDGASDAWQAALDHYDKARRILDHAPSPADVVGAIVLVERGSAALDSALANRDWTPATPCYFNPLHGRATGTARWGSEQGGVDVPACKACGDAVDAGRTPDALDFLQDGVPHHYFTLDLEPWSSTGYGALDPDLLGRVYEP